jgi:FlaG protein
MSFDVPPISRPDQVPQTAPTEKVKAVGPVAGVDAVSVDAIPSTPPAELFEEMQAAGRRVDELREQNRELHFSYSEAEHRVVVEVRDLDGNVIRTIPPSKFLDVAGGEPLDI